MMSDAMFNSGVEPTIKLALTRAYHSPAPAKVSQVRSYAAQVGVRSRLTFVYVKLSGDAVPNCWDRGMQKLPDKGAIGLLINIAILVAVLNLRWPGFEF
jgi:hypothetical protein